MCEQLEDPAEARKRGRKSVVRRDVVRLVTPGTLTEDTLLDARRNNYLLAIARARAVLRRRGSRFALAWIDISTGEFRIAECDRVGLAAEIARLEPGEIIVSDALYSDAELAPLFALAAGGDAARPRRVRRRDRRAAARVLISRSPPPKRSARCRGWSSPPPRPASPMSSARSSASARRCRRRCARRRARRMAIDQATRGNLELMRTLGGERRGSLLAAIDRTVTAAGSRLLAQRLAAPLTDPAQIARRLDAVEAFCRRRGSARRHARAACRRRPISRARCRGWWSAAAGRAISPRSATASLAAADLAARARCAQGRRAEIADAIAALPRNPIRHAGRGIAAALGGRTAAVQARRRLRARGL